MLHLFITCNAKVNQMSKFTLAQNVSLVHE